MNYLIYGTSYHLIDDEIRKILGDKKYEIKSFLDITLKEVIEDLSYLSMFETEKIVVAKDFDALFNKDTDGKEADLDSLIEYLKHPNNQSIAIFISATKIPERSKKNKELLSYFNIITTPSITKQYELVKVMDEYIRKSGFAISQSALNKFATKCALSIDVAIMEFEKIKMMKRDNKLISEKDVDEFISNYNTTDIFEFKDAVINKKIKESFILLDDLETSKIELVPLVVMLAKEYITLYNVKALVEMKQNNDSISSKLGNMHPYRVKLLKEAASKYTLAEIKEKILSLCNIDLKIVTKDNLGFDELRQFIIGL